MFRAFLAFVVLVLASPLSAEQGDRPDTPVLVERASQIEAVLAGTLAAEKVFAPSFLREVSPAELTKLAAQLTAENGRIVAVEDVRDLPEGAAIFSIRFEKGRADASFRLSRSPPRQVIGFRIGSVTPNGDTSARIAEEFAALPGTSGFGVYRLSKNGPELVAGRDPERQFAIGSSFKLYVLSTLAHEIGEHRRRWSDVVTLDRRSIPSGQMQDWPAHAPVTLQTLATMMISISDNTAADALIDVLGRKAVEKEMLASGHADPAHALPLLKTVELFALKSDDPTRVQAYARADVKVRRALLDRWAPTLDRAHIDLGRLIGSPPNAIDTVEWFASAEDIARILARLRDLKDRTALDILAINPMLGEGMAGDWAYSGYKGGSEPGVLNLSWLLQDKAGEWYAVSASWNDPTHTLDEHRLIALGRRLIKTLPRPPSPAK